MGPHLYERVHRWKKVIIKCHPGTFYFIFTLIMLPQSFTTIYVTDRDLCPRVSLQQDMTQSRRPFSVPDEAMGDDPVFFVGRKGPPGHPESDYYVHMDLNKAHLHSLTSYFQSLPVPLYQEPLMLRERRFSLSLFKVISKTDISLNYEDVRRHIHLVEGLVFQCKRTGSLQTIMVEDDLEYRSVTLLELIRVMLGEITTVTDILPRAAWRLIPFLFPHTPLRFWLLHLSKD